MEILIPLFMVLMFFCKPVIIIVFKSFNQSNFIPIYQWRSDVFFVKNHSIRLVLSDVLNRFWQFFQCLQKSPFFALCLFSKWPFTKINLCFFKTS